MIRVSISMTTIEDRLKRKFRGYLVKEGDYEKHPYEIDCQNTLNRDELCKNLFKFIYDIIADAKIFTNGWKDIHIYRKVNNMFVDAYAIARPNMTKNQFRKSLDTGFVSFLYNYPGSFIINVDSSQYYVEYDIMNKIKFYFSFIPSDYLKLSEVDTYISQLNTFAIEFEYENIIGKKRMKNNIFFIVTFYDITLDVRASKVAKETGIFTGKKKRYMPPILNPSVKRPVFNEENIRKKKTNEKRKEISEEDILNRIV